MTDHELREHPRYPLRAFAELGNTDQKWAAHLLDISSQGARIALLDEYFLTAGDTVRLKIELPLETTSDGVQQYLHLNGIVAHQLQHILGISYQPDSEQDAELLKTLLINFES